MSTREILICATLGALSALVVIAAAPLMATLAATAPALYALVGGYSAVAPFLALRIIRVAGSATVTALCCAIIAWPFNALGILLLIAIAAPAIAMDACYRLRRFIGTPRALWVGASGAAVVIFLISLPVISPEQLSPLLAVLILSARLVSYAAACWLSAIIAGALERAGATRHLREP